MNTQKARRYPGVQPFKEHQEHLFFGRNEDKGHLLDLILLEKMVVLFGKSGYGKSSLLNAGIIPALKSDEDYQYQPIEIRFFQWNNDPNDNLSDKFLKKLHDSVPTIPSQNEFLNNRNDLEPSFWLAIKLRQQHDKHRFVFIFDQFEEFFTYPLAQQVEFKRQFADVLFQDYPNYIWRKKFDWTSEQKEIIANPLHCKSVFSIRADRMSFLDSLKDALPTILHKRYELRPLTPEQAKDAITKPAIKNEEAFATAPFVYSTDALDLAIAELTKRNSDAIELQNTIGVETFLLQILCEYVESIILSGKVQELNSEGIPIVTADLLPRMETLYEDYYHRKLKELRPEQVDVARRVLEDGLLAEDVISGEGRRMSVDSHSLLSQFRKMGLDVALLEALEKTYLIRREVNTVGGFSFEISHDTLVAPIQKAKKERQEKEEKQRRKIEEANKIAELEKTRKQLQTTRGLLLLAFVALISAGYLGYNAKIAKEEAEKNLSKAYQSDIRRYELERNSIENNLQALIKQKAENDIIQYFQVEKIKIQRKIDSTNNLILKIKH